MPNTAAWADTGFFVALFARRDQHHASATKFLRDNPGVELHSIWPVITEASHFLTAAGREALLEWLEAGAVRMHAVEIADLAAIRRVLNRYRNLEPDFTDAALVALASERDIDAIVTVDLRDFSAYRLAGNKPFRRLWL